MLRTAKRLVEQLINFNNIRKVCFAKEYAFQRDLAFIVRYVHSIEKGLSIRNPRKGFGYEKITEVFSVINHFIEMGIDISEQTEILMFVDALDEYFNYHQKVGFDNEKIQSLKEKYNVLVQHVKPHAQKYGGTIDIVSSPSIDVVEIEKLFSSRHSIRCFSGEPVDKEKIKKAVELAWKAPSACNRQGTRIHILSGDKKAVFQNWLGGIGGFEKEIDTIIVVTAKQSCYVMNEQYQYIVSSSILAGYLSLALEAQGIGACLIQRPVLWTKEWNEVRTKLNIPADEQIILIIGCGIPCEKYKVPVSHRLSFDEVAKFY